MANGIAEFDPLTGDPIAKGNGAASNDHQTTDPSFRCKACGWSGPNHALDGMTQGEIRAYGKKLSYAALIEIVADKSQPGATRKACAELLIERDEGKSPETIQQNVNVTSTQILGLDRVQLLRIMEQAVERQRRMLGNTTSSNEAPPIIDN